MYSNIGLITGKKNKQSKRNKYTLYEGISKLLFFYILIILIQISSDIRKKKMIYNFACEPNKVKPKNKSYKADNLKIALCTMGKRENLYVKEFVDYYYNLGIDQMFIYDDNEPNTEKISDVIDSKYNQFVTVIENRNVIKNQSLAFTDCYHRNINKFDWFLMVDMDEFLYIVKDTLKDYLVNQIFDKCDFIKFHWILSTDNNLLHYDPRPLFERFKPPFIKSIFIKTMVRGNISDLKYWVHSPRYSPKRNITCNNIGEKINYKKLNFEKIYKINVEKAFIIHFRFKSTEELIMKFTRGYSDWLGSWSKSFIKISVREYLEQNELTLEKIDYIEKGLNISLFLYKIKYFISKFIYL